MIVYANILGKWTELGDNDLIEDMVPEQFVNDVFLKKYANKSSDFIRVTSNYNDYLIHISQIQSHLEN